MSIKEIPFIGKAAFQLKRAGRFLDWPSFFTCLTKGETEVHPVHRHFIPRICRQIIQNREFIICDVGANYGLFFQRIVQYCPQVEVIAFEPQRSCLPVLESLKAKNSRITIRPIGLGSQDGEMIFYEHQNSGLSSFREFKGDYTYSTVNEGDNKPCQYTVPVSTFDQELLNTDPNKHILLKIDTQGFEREVLEGAKQLLKQNRITCIVLELMTLEKYKGQATWVELLNFLQNEGFILFDLQPGHREASTEMLTETDAVFIKRV